MNNLEKTIESLIFYKNEPVEIKKIAKLLEAGEKEVKEALQNLDKSLENRGICLVMTESEAGLATAPEISRFMDKIAKDEMSGEIGKAGLETLAIVLYNGPVSRREVDFIRGVNSTFILRNLAVRGLVEREQDPKDQRVVKYKSSLSLLSHLGIKSKEELPEFDKFRSAISEALTDKEKDEGTE
jgi:segregation and condensation protein B